MPDRACSLCRNPATKQCACKKAWYCGKECQTSDWVRHVFVCKPSKITTAHYIALAVNDNHLPEHPQACIDYGFTRTRERSMLFGLYIGLMKRLNVKTQTLHKRRLGGTLVDNIQKEFENIPEGSRGPFYLWFLRNRDVVSGKSDDLDEAQANDVFRRAWCFIGRSPTTSDDDIERYVKVAPNEEKDCFLLYGMLLTQTHPNPDTPFWISFGFCSVCTQEEEMRLALLYLMLINRCTFPEFLKAYKSSSLIPLFESKGLHITNPLTTHILSGDLYSNDSVWHLKQFIERKNIHGPEDTTITLMPFVQVDYGFCNCRTPEEQIILLDIYREFFALGKNADPLQLHQACVKGRLYAYFSQDLKFRLKPRKVYERLLMNPYRLSDL